jgi:hypothetical protein
LFNLVVGRRVRVRQIGLDGLVDVVALQPFGEDSGDERRPVGVADDDDERELPLDRLRVPGFQLLFIDPFQGLGQPESREPVRVTRL